MKKIRKGPILLLILGLALLGYGLWGVWSAPDVLQYVVQAPSSAAENRAAELDRLIDRKEEAFKDITDIVTSSAIYAVAPGQPVSAREQATALLLAVDKGYFEVFPAFLKEGRLIGDAECKGRQYVCVLDEKLAFELFRGEDALDRTVTLGGEEYRVIGVARHSRQIGQADDYRVWIPLRAAASQPLMTLNVAAQPLHSSGALIMFKNTVRTRWQDGGSVYALEKEATRRLILPRMVLLALGLYAVVWLYGWMGRRTAACAALLRRDLSQSYLRQIFFRVAGIVLLLALGYAAVTGLLYLLMAFAFRPLYTFTEWVPECIVEWSSLKSVFRGLVDEASALTSVSTIEMESLNYYGGFVRWGCVALLVAALLMWMSRAERRRRSA